MPDITMLPIIARFFTVSIDYMLDFNLHNADEQVEDLCGQAFALRKGSPGPGRGNSAGGAAALPRQ